MSAFFVLAVGLAPARADETVGVAQVVDGDSLRFADGREVRLIGINAPEFGKDGRPGEPLAVDAHVLLTQLIAGKEIRVEYDDERKDRYRRSLAHAYLNDGTSIQQIMLRAGMAVVVAIPPNLAHLDDYRRAEAESRRAARGVWAHPYFKPRDAAQLSTADAGFRFVTGTVRRIGQGRKSIYLDLTDHFSLAIPRQHWRYFGGEPQRFLGRRVIARGWITSQQNRLRLPLSHPAMLEVIN